MVSLPGGFELEMHVADEMRSTAVSASLVRICIVGWLRAGQLSDLWPMLCGAWGVLAEVDLRLWLALSLMRLVSIFRD